MVCELLLFESVIKNVISEIDIIHRYSYYWLLKINNQSIMLKKYK